MTNPKQNNRFRSLFENSRDAIFIRSVDGVYLEVNRAMLELFGYSRDEMTGMNVERLYVDAADRETLEKAMLRDGFVRDYEVSLKRKDGSVMLCMASASEWRNEDNELLGYEGIIRDITEQRRMQKALRESEERYRLIFENSPLGIFHFDRNGQIIDCNDKFVSVIGSSRKALIGFNMLTSLNDELMRGEIQATIETGRGYYEGVYHSVTADKATPVRVIMNQITSASGDFLGAVGMVEDVSESMESLEAYRRSEERFRAIFEGAAVGVALTNLVGIIVEANGSFAEITGRSVDELKGERISDFTHPEDYDGEKNIIADLVAERINSCQIVKRYIRKDGNHTWVRMSASLLHDREGRPEFVLGIAENITERKKAREELAREKERLAVTLASIGDGVITTDVRGRVTLLNGVAEKLTGWSSFEAAGRPLEEVFVIINEETRQTCENPAIRVMATGAIVGLANHTLLISKDGSERAIADSGAPIRGPEGDITGVVLVFRDVTEARKTEEELLKSQKLESIGLLAGGIAHDFNNILTSIMGSIALVKLKVERESEIQSILHDAERAASQARELTHQLLTFSRGGVPIKRSIQIGGLLLDVCGFSTRGSNVRCECDAPDDLWPVDADIGQISQVLNNMLINARQAMPGGGTITVSARNHPVEKESLSLMSGGRRTGPAEPGSYVRIDISDQGSGIPAELIGKIFDPYFTTKERGIGLGLAIAYSIVKKHEGHIDVVSRPGEGTVFSVYLPMSREGGSPEAESPQALQLGKGRVLLMDDDPNILSVTGRILRHLGYDVQVSHNGHETLEIYKKALKSGTPFDAVIMDLTIPGSMGGKDCMAELLLVDPEAKAVVSSGYSNDPVMADFSKYGFSGIITKPYRIEDLSSVLNRLVSHQVNG